MGKSNELSKRERQIMDIIYKNKKATVAEVRSEISDDISYSTVRALLGILEKKGHVVHESDGQKYIYTPRVSRKKAVNEAVKNFMEIFCDNSLEKAVSALLEFDQSKLTETDYEHLNQIIETHKKGDKNG